MAKVAKILKVPEEAIKNFEEENAVNIITNTFTDFKDTTVSTSGYNNQCTFNPLDKLMEALEENKKLYERLLKSEQEKIELLKDKKD